jgi:uncharacterized protein
MPDPDFEGANAYALRRLRAELAPGLAYHCLAHTCEDVVPAVERLARLEGVTAVELQLLRTAAFYHDLGFVEGPHDHETVSARIAAAILPEYGFTPEQVATVAGMIEATRLPQQPKTLLEGILADADLDVLGREDFLPRNAALRAEAAALGPAPTDQQWYCGQARFLAGHSYFTRAAQRLRGARKREHLIYLRACCAAATPITEAWWDRPRVGPPADWRGEPSAPGTGPAATGVHDPAG